MRRVRRVETRETAGELGALLLESKLIKELKPMFNVAQKQRRRIVIAERKTMPGGYVAVHLKAVDAIDPSKSGGILGVFKHTTQAKEFMTEIARRHRLCLKLLGLERPRTACFAYHLGACNGACIGENRQIVTMTGWRTLFGNGVSLPGRIVPESSWKKRLRRDDRRCSSSITGSL